MARRVKILAPMLRASGIDVEITIATTIRNKFEKTKGISTKIIQAVPHTPKSKKSFDSSTKIEYDLAIMTAEVITNGSTFKVNDIQYTLIDVEDHTIQNDYFLYLGKKNDRL